MRRMPTDWPRSFPGDFELFFGDLQEGFNMKQMFYLLKCIC